MSIYLCKAAVIQLIAQWIGYNGSFDPKYIISRFGRSSIFGVQEDTSSLLCYCILFKLQ